MPVRSLDELPSLTPLQMAIYETDLLDLTLRDSIKLVTSRVGFFVGQHRYLLERTKIDRFIAQYGPPPHDKGWDPVHAPREAAPQVGSP
ncbi:MAG TPA: hypothetical protein VGQ62_07190 [Chloroflexota bacterium]|jgi:hypothetical protein|nr:hypothetical protein [Chloroflexota bacterium]